MEGNEYDIVKTSLLLSLGWVNESIHSFSLAGDEKSNSNQEIAALKPLSELALTLCILRRCGIRLPALDNIANKVWLETAGGETLARQLIARNDFLPCCAYYSSMHELGYRSSKLQLAIGMISRYTACRSLPLLPWGRLALYYNLWKLGFCERPINLIQGLYSETFPEPWLMSTELAYAITHEVFYLTDFGNLPNPNLTWQDYLLFWTPYWAEKFIHESNWDITGEFSMVCSCLGSHSRAMSICLQVCKTQRQDGSVIGPAGAGSCLYSEDNNNDDYQYFMQCYHTTLVFIMSAALVLKNAAITAQESSLSKAERGNFSFR